MDGNTTTEFSNVPVAIVIVGFCWVSAGVIVIVPIALSKSPELDKPTDPLSKVTLLTVLGS